MKITYSLSIIAAIQELREKLNQLLSAYRQIQTAIEQFMAEEEDDDLMVIMMVIDRTLH